MCMCVCVNTFKGFSNAHVHQTLSISYPNWFSTALGGAISKHETALNSLIKSLGDGCHEVIFLN